MTSVAADLLYTNCRKERVFCDVRGLISGRSAVSFPEVGIMSILSSRALRPALRWIAHHLADFARVWVTSIDPFIRHSFVQICVVCSRFVGELCADLAGDSYLRVEDACVLCSGDLCGCGVRGVARG